MNGQSNSIGSINGKAIYIRQDEADTDRSTNWEFISIPKVITEDLIKSIAERTVNIKIARKIYL